MIALDTNVVVRALLCDEPEQARRVGELLRSGTSFVPKTVVLETVWVLESAYGVDDAAIRTGLTKLLGHPEIVFEDRDQILAALRGNEQGLDFADALHHAASQAAESFRTFDTRLVRRAARAGLKPPVRSV
jgi:predicted nucleic-acid-binding protein